MPFANPVVGGSVLIRPAIQSPNYVATVSGWTINADGTAEFNDVTLRGELLVTDPDGSYVRIFDDAGNGAVILLKPADVAAIGTITPGQLFSGSDFDGTNKFATMFLEGPTFAGHLSPFVALNVTDTPMTILSYITAEADVIRLTAGRTCELSGDTTVNGLVVPGATQVLNVLQSANDSIAVTGTWTNMAGVTTLAFTKSRNAALSKLVATVSVTSQATAAATRLQFGVRDGTTDWFVAQMTHPSVNIRASCSGTVDITGLVAGGYTFTPRWQRAAGAGTGQRFATDDQYCLTISEVPV